MKLKRCIEHSSNPEEVANRFESLCENAIARNGIDRLSDDNQCLLIKILDISNFLYRYLNYNPEAISLIGKEPEFPAEVSSMMDPAELRGFKYRTLLMISGMDLSNNYPYEYILELLTKLADGIIAGIDNTLVSKAGKTGSAPNSGIAALALGKLGAREINYSSDIDLIFVAEANDANVCEEHVRHIRQFCKIMETRTDAGFLYRVDLNLRPWGRNAPLILDIDSTEQYYEASKEAWERFAWLRARPVAGNYQLANELLARLDPFVFHRALSADDVERFIRIKSAMAELRYRRGIWNIKTGEGGIRDIEFFVQLLQIINGARIKELKVTNTVQTLEQLCRHDLITRDEFLQLKKSYFFLRKLEHRVQMQDEKRTHALPEEKDKLMRIACSMGYSDKDPEQQYADFNEDLLLHRQVAKHFFDRVLNGEIETE